jgi:hypothetical protein
LQHYYWPHCNTTTGPIATLLPSLRRILNNPTTVHKYQTTKPKRVVTWQGHVQLCCWQLSRCW